MSKFLSWLSGESDKVQNPNTASNKKRAVTHKDPSFSEVIHTVDKQIGRAVTRLADR